MAKQPSPRRRFQFRLRTLLIAVAVLAAIGAPVVWVVRDRNRLIQERDRAIQERDDALDRLNGPQASMTMYKQGDTIIIEIPASSPPEDIAKVQRLYPGAKIKLVAPKQPQKPPSTVP